MQLIMILIVMVGLLTILSGIIVFFGPAKGDRIRSAWYLIMTIFVSLWMASLAYFVSAGPDAIDAVYAHVSCAFISAILLDAAFLGYSAWNKKYGKLITLIFLVFGLVICGAILVDHCALYSEIILSNTGNQIIFNINPFYFAYNGYFATIVPATLLIYLRDFLHTRSKRWRHSSLAIMLSYGAASAIVLVTNLIMPIFGQCAASWVGPLAVAIVILMIYFMILRYRIIRLSLRWLRVFSYIVVVTTIAVIYMIIFSIIFAALFRGSTPSIEVIVLNFIMIVIFIALMPVMNGFINFINKLILDQHIRKQEHSKPPIAHSSAAKAAAPAAKKPATSKSKKEHTKL